MEASKLKRVQVSKEVWFWARNLNITIQNMFEEMGTFAGVEKMLLSEFPGLIGKWHNELNPIKSYWQLKSVVVDKCPFINAVPSRLMLVLDNLSYLQVRDCELLEEIFDLEGLEVVESTRVLPQLRELNLVNLPKLRRLWNKDLQESLCFNSLKSLILYNCSNLGHALSPSMAQCLANLEVMEIKECGQMEGVIVEEEAKGSAMKKITFPKLQWMMMEYLPNLTCFLLGKNHILECPKLQKMIIAHCPKMESLIRQSQMEDDHSTPSFFTSQHGRLPLFCPPHRSIDLEIWPSIATELQIWKSTTVACSHGRAAVAVAMVADLEVPSRVTTAYGLPLSPPSTPTVGSWSAPSMAEPPLHRHNCSWSLPVLIWTGVVPPDLVSSMDASLARPWLARRLPHKSGDHCLSMAMSLDGEFEISTAMDCEIKQRKKK
ncbi:hypothetical protein EUGRSUZ_G00715 [Eucalyptus grandis]|uniref:Uncharacterized protein n=2 Tax=Eucalyptus grandis TaxID=71139 RepID=A0ACC3K0N7_EUCGR|nr:hypothetical protein EUGRSUZ_G00715 [Eucalyptus grandis]